MPDFSDEATTGEAFEASVREVARSLYRGANSTGSIILNGRERDEVIDTGTELIIIEATKRRDVKKIEGDLKKSADLVRDLRKERKYSEYNFRILLVTLHDPTADQNRHVADSKVGCPKEIISFSRLFSRLFDARHYLKVRDGYFFGSIRNPANDLDLDVPPSTYIPTALTEEGTGTQFSATSISTEMAKGGIFALLGDYGCGKSMTLRDIYIRLRQDFYLGKTVCCPIYINLREHVAQNEPSEALIRHSSRVGFDNPNSLISAWRAGYVIPILDGFDELIPPQFTVSIDNIKQARRYAVELVKRFITETPNDVPVLIAGRESYFDDRDEAKQALGLGTRARIYDLAGFSDGDIQKFLKKNYAVVPTWLPSKPLLLGYLANSGLLEESGLTTLSPAVGWDHLIDRICEREVEQIWGPGFEANALRLYIEGLATRVRKAPTQPLSKSDLKRTFHQVFGKDSDEPAELLTARLPGLGAVPGRPGARNFVDEAFSDAAASGVLSRFIDTPFTIDEQLAECEAPLGELGKDLVIHRLGGNYTKLEVSLHQSSIRESLSTTSVDIFSIMNDLEIQYKGESLSIIDGCFEKLSITTIYNFSNLLFEKCIIAALELERLTEVQESDNFPKFKECVIDKIYGVMSRPC